MTLISTHTLSFAHSRERVYAFKDLCDQTEPTYIIQYGLSHLNTLNHITSLWPCKVVYSLQIPLVWDVEILGGHYPACHNLSVSQRVNIKKKWVNYRHNVVQWISPAYFSYLTVTLYSLNSNFPFCPSLNSLQLPFSLPWRHGLF